MNEPLWAIVGVIIGGLLTGLINYCLQKKQFEHNIIMFQLQNQSKETVKEILEDLLWHKKFTYRSIQALRKNVGGYTDDEIRQLLHEIGAVKTIRESDNVELWHLKERENE